MSFSGSGVLAGFEDLNEDLNAGEKNKEFPKKQGKLSDKGVPASVSMGEGSGVGFRWVVGGGFAQAVENNLENPNLLK